MYNAIDFTLSNNTISRLRIGFFDKNMVYLHM